MGKEKYGILSRFVIELIARKFTHWFCTRCIFQTLPSFLLPRLARPRPFRAWLGSPLLPRRLFQGVLGSLQSFCLTSGVFEHFRTFENIREFTMGRHSGKKCTFCPLALVWHAIRDKTLFYPLFLYGTPSGSKIPPLSFTSCMISHPGIIFLRIRLSTPVVTCLYIIYILEFLRISYTYDVSVY